ncbi:hypothetical protein [Wolbachia endosymbiont (group B) of Eucosma cana]|uniref:hypothetical protein n=1 Tax=Wolbachia endosymbiont (group B) of Eucosma cana TaxID=2954012 RepID=UPI002227D52C|nr:hypothetical protein [Wolbachia endosymbiont (group B) of Eucosma cana]
MGITKFVFGFDKSDVTALQESQNIDAKKFQEVFSALKEWQEAQKIDAKQFEEVFSALKEWQEAQKIDVEQFGKVFSALKDKVGTKQFEDVRKIVLGDEENPGLSKTVSDHTGQIADLTETVADQEKTLLICAIVSAVAAIAVTSFVAFCIYQGVKLDREKKNDSSKDTPTNEKFSVDSAEKLNNSLEKC